MIAAPTWVPVPSDELERQLRGSAYGTRADGQVRVCGRYLVARRPSTHVLIDDVWELYGREAGRWSIKTCHPTRERAEAEAGRQIGLARLRSAEAAE